MANPWMKFYPQDWRGDQGLRMVSLAARGLWMEMLCIMHSATPYGHLVLNGKPLEGDALSRLAGTSTDQTAALMAELESAGVFSRSRKGVIYSRRMVADKSRSEKGRKSVNKRWAQAHENKAENDAPNRSPNREPNTQKPEARTITNVIGETPSLAERLFGECLDYIMSTGHSEKNARSLIGQWRKRFKDAETVRRIAYCQANSISDPVAYIPKMSGGNSYQDERAAFLAKRYGTN